MYEWISFGKSELTGDYEYWYYCGIPIFPRKVGESLRCVIYYGSAKVYIVPNLIRAMCIIDTLLYLNEQRDLLPAGKKFKCPCCSVDGLNREKLHEHYAAKHVENLADTFEVMVKYETDFDPAYFQKREVRNERDADLRPQV